MNVVYEIRPDLITRSALALGFFDGVHPGHGQVIKKAVAEAERLGIPSAVVTFRDHPRTLTAGRSPLLLTLLEQRLELFAQLGIDKTLVLTFTEEICRLTPRQYVQTVLVEALGARSVSIGYNHHFGRNREGDPALLAELGAELGFEVHITPPVLLDGSEVSSSRIREAILGQDMELAARLLGRPYAVPGTVVRGDGRGRAIGYPTANLRTSDIQLIPPRGVYAAVARLADGRKLPAVVNLGFRPTVCSNDRLITEAHLLDFDEDLYDGTLTLEFWRFLRGETKFESVDALKVQIGRDCNQARELLPSAIGLGGSEQRLPA